MKISDTFLPEFNMEMANTRKVLERVPDEKFGWKPHEKSWPMGGLANHIANLAGWATVTINTEELNLVPPFTLPPTNNSAELLALFDKNVGEARAAIAGASDDNLRGPWSLKMEGKLMMTMPRAALLRGMVLNHIVHHRGQLTVYLRLNDIPVPGMYGPSADEPKMF